ncbi:hypothetical protein PRIPAC_93900, partial [Pristionchus pacificus]|uniref:Uncharacterized protein n=1 Tax=Pristionchus pacificus TaxID=54126 RepID=A0A2A6CID9_PRIPA
IVQASLACTCFPRKNCVIPKELIPLIQTLPDGTRELVLQGGSIDVVLPVANSSDVIRLDQNTYVRMKSLVETALARIDSLLKDVSDESRIDVSPVQVKTMLDTILAGRDAQMAFERVFENLREVGLHGRLTPVGEKLIVNSFVHSIENFERTGRPSDTLLTYLNLLRAGNALDLPVQKLDNFTARDLLLGATNQDTETTFMPLLFLPAVQTTEMDARELIDPIVHFEGRMRWKDDFTIVSKPIVELMQRMSDSLLFTTRLRLRGLPILMHVAPGLRGRDGFPSTLLMVRVPVVGTINEIEDMLAEVFPTNLLITGFRIFYESSGLATGRE